MRKGEGRYGTESEAAFPISHIELKEATDPSRAYLGHVMRLSGEGAGLVRRQNRLKRYKLIEPNGAALRPTGVITVSRTRARYARGGGRGAAAGQSMAATAAPARYRGHGDRLPVPACRTGFLYTVQRNDTMFLVARRFGVPLNALVQANPQVEAPNRIVVGQKLCIPTVLRVPPAVTRVPVEPEDVQLAPGYRLEAVAAGFTYPTAVTFDDNGRVYVAEAGFSYGPARSEGGGRILRVNGDGSVTEIARGFRGPVTAITYRNGFFHVAEGALPGRILRVGLDGSRQVLVDNLRSGADHYTSDIAFGPDRAMYFGVGVATNSAVVGVDNFVFGWLPTMPDFHDVPARNLTLRGVNFDTVNPLAPQLLGTRVTTGAYKPFGEPSEPGEVIVGERLANGVIYRANPDGSGLEVYADGLRNPFGLGFSPDGRLLAIDQGYDARGSRPISDAPDPLWEIVRGGWYGWPDFVAGRPVTDPQFQTPNFPALEPLLADHPPLAGEPIVNFAPQSATMKFDFSRNPAFGFEGQLFAAMFGTGATATHPEARVTGFRVVRVNLDTRQINDFLVNRRPGPQGTGPERPVDVKFDPTGRAMYIVDFGNVDANPSGIIPFANSGILWRVTRAE